MKKSRQSLSKDQRGIVSFIVTLVLMIVITLVVIGFAQISRREQRQALDRQLSTQAFYAAESGINDATQAIQIHGYLKDKNNCKLTGADKPYFTKARSTLDAANNISYTCLLISQSPDTLKYTVHNYRAMSADMSFADSTGTPQRANDITITWQATGGVASSFSTQKPSFPSTSAWTGNTALLRLAATDLSGANPYQRDNLNANTYTTFLYPDKNGTSPGNRTNFIGQGSPGGYGLQGSIIPADCTSNTSVCTVVLHFPGLGVSHVFLRIGAIYDDADVTITAGNLTVTSLNITGAQAVIDATGKAQDVLRRVQVHLPLQPQNDEPAFTVQSVDGICKQLNVAPGYAADGCPIIP